MSLNFVFTVVVSILSDFIRSPLRTDMHLRFTYCEHFLSFSSHISKVFAIDLGIRRRQRRTYERERSIFEWYSLQLWKCDRIASRTIDLFSVDWRRPMHCVYKTQNRLRKSRILFLVHKMRSLGPRQWLCDCAARQETSVHRIYLVTTFDCRTSVQQYIMGRLCRETAFWSATYRVHHCRLPRFSPSLSIDAVVAEAMCPGELLRLTHWTVVSFCTLRCRMADCMCFPIRFFAHQKDEKATKRVSQKVTQNLHRNFATRLAKNRTIRSVIFGWCKRANS